MTTKQWWSDLVSREMDDGKYSTAIWGVEGLVGVGVGELADIIPEGTTQT